MPIVPIFYSTETNSVHLNLEDAILAEQKHIKSASDEKKLTELLYQFECLRNEYNHSVGTIRDKYKSEFDKLLKDIKSLGVNVNFNIQ